MSKGRNKLIFGQSAAITRVLDDCADFASSDDPVLLTGETGTGKSWLARHIHDISRRPGRYIEAPVPQLEELAQGQLRGNTEGAFTDAKRARKGVIELADGGTLFLDEVATASPQLQEMLLTIVEASEVWPLGASRPVPVNVRMVFASNESLPERSSDGAFRILPADVRVLAAAQDGIERHVRFLGAWSSCIVALAMRVTKFACKPQTAQMPRHHDQDGSQADAR